MLSLEWVYNASVIRNTARDAHSMAPRPFAEKIDLIALELDAKLRELAYTTMPVTYDEALILSKTLGDRFTSRFIEIVETMTSQGFELSLSLATSANKSNPLVLLCAKNPTTGQYGIPNIAYLDTTIVTDERSVNTNTKEKKTIAATGSDDLEAEDTKTIQVELFNAPVRLVLSLSDNLDTPCNSNVQYTSAAFEEAFVRLDQILRGDNTNYCHLFHEVLLNQVRTELISRSGGYFGLHEVPTIENEQSGVNELGQIRVTPFCPLAFGTDGDQHPVLIYNILQTDDDSPYPVIF